MKRTFALILCLFFLLGLSACKEEKSIDKKKPVKSSQNDSDSDSGSNGGSGNGNGNNGVQEGSGTKIYTREDGVTLPPLTAPEESAGEVTDEFLTALENADWETVNKRLFLYSFSPTDVGQVMSGGIMEKIMGSMTVVDQETTDNGDGTYTVTVTIEAISMRDLLESLPDSVYSEASAQNEMLLLADTAARTTFTGQFTILRYSQTGSYYIEPEISFVNAITGGLYDIYEELMQQEEAVQ